MADVQAALDVAPDPAKPVAGPGDPEPLRAHAAGADLDDLEETASLAELQQASKTYGGQPALGPVNLTIPRGVVGLLGANGAGKSTMIRMLLGILPPTSGSVQVLGRPAGSPEARRRIGYAPEGAAAFPGLRGVQAVAYAGRLSGMAPADALQRAHQVLDYVGLEEARYRLVSGYSTGMRQRLKLAQALVHGPDVLVLDEPTEGVDPESRRHLLALLGELAREHGLSILLSTHLLHDVEEVATHAIVLHRGQVVAQGPVGQLKAAPRPGYAVRVHGDTAPLLERLRAQNVAVEPQPNGLRVALEDPAAILRHAQAAGVVVRQLAPLQLTLADAYEQAVGGATHA